MTMWLCPWFLYNIGLCTSGSGGSGCCSDQSFPSNGRPICFLPADSGPCNDQYNLRWYYDPRTGLCRQFMYGGCAGNSNNFVAKSNCVEACNALPRDTDFCKMSVDSGPCTAHYDRWYYDESMGRCQQFVFGGCDGNDNRFDSEEECLAACIKAPDSAMIDVAVALPKSASNPCRSPMTESPTICTNVVTESPERCLQPLHRGPCDANLPRWYFDLTSRECLPFAYGGCHGNRNRFLTRQICHTQCRSKMSQENARGSHLQSMVTTRLIANTLKSTDENVFRRPTGVPSGLQEINGDNRGRDSAGAEIVVNGAIVVVCLLPKDPGPCSDHIALWYFDATTDTCRRFTYGGCHGNANRFASLDDCHRTCLEQEHQHQQQQQQQQPTMMTWKKGPFFQAALVPLQEGRPQPRPPGPPLPSFRTVPPVRVEPSLRNKLALRRTQTQTTEQRQQKRDEPKSRSRMTSSQTMLVVSDEAERQMDHDGVAWQHDESVRVDDVASVEEKKANGEEDYNPSLDIDDVPLDRDRCSLPEDRGSLCAKWRIYWLHDDHVSTCRRFYYGGCDGNENRFKTKEECEIACPEPV